MNTKRELPRLRVQAGRGGGSSRALQMETILPHLQRVQRLSSGEYLVCCPAHDDREPSLSLRELADGTLLWHCHAGCSQEQVGEALRKLAGVDTRRREPVGCTLQAYAEYRCLSVDKLREWGLTDGRRNGRQAVRIPYFDEQGQEVSVQWRIALHKGDGERFKRDGSPCLYGLWLAPSYTPEYLLLVEGVSDAHICWTAGLQAVALPSSDHRASMLQFWGLAERFEKIYVAVDNDSAGEACLKALAECAPESLRARCSVIRLPAHFKDLGDVWLACEGNAERFTQELRTFERVPLPQAQEADGAQEPEKAQQGGELVLQPVAYDDVEVDYAVSIIPNLVYIGRLTLLAGAPGAGKTVMCAELADALQEGGTLWGIYRLPPQRVLWLGFDQPFAQIKEYFEAYYAARSRDIVCLPESQLYPLTYTTYDAYKQLIQDSKIGVVIVDTILDWLMPQDINDEAQIRERFALVRQLCRETGAGVVGLLHTNKESEWRGDVQVTAVAGSLRIGGCADVVAILRLQHKDGQETAELTVPKARGGIRWKMTFARQHYRFVPLRPEELPPSEWRVIQSHLEQAGEATYDELLQVLHAAGLTLTHNALKARVQRWSAKGLVVCEQRGFPRKTYIRLSRVTVATPTPHPPTTDANDATDATERCQVPLDTGEKSTQPPLCVANDVTDTVPVASFASVATPAGGYSDCVATDGACPSPCANSLQGQGGDPALEALLAQWTRPDDPFHLEPDELDALRTLWNAAQQQGFPRLMLEDYNLLILEGRESWLEALKLVKATPAVSFALRLLGAGVPNPCADESTPDGTPAGDSRGGTTPQETTQQEA